MDKACVAKDLDTENKLKLHNSDIWAEEKKLLR